MSWHINHFDTKCDEECEYSFNRKIDPPRVDSDEHGSSDDDVFPQALVVLVRIRPDHKANKSV